MKCAVITPVGPGHTDMYEVCRASIEEAWVYDQGPFEALEIMPMWDLEGAHGRSARRNSGIDEAAARGCDWLFFLDADDLMNMGAFGAFGKFSEGLDAVWGNICETSIGDDEIRLREGQIVTATTLEEILVTPPFLSLQMGHFVRTECAAAVKFDVEMDTGEDFKYYLEMWSRFRCAKVPTVFFINRRGGHSVGPRSANGADWNKAVEQVVLGYCREREMFSDVTFEGKPARFVINNPFNIIQRHHVNGSFFEVEELKTLCDIVGRGKSIVEVGANIGNHIVYYAQHMDAQKIYPFEPNPDAIDLLTKNIEANGLNGIIDSRGIGIGAGAAYGKFAIELPGENNLGAARLKEGEGELEVFTLDEKLADTSYDFMKIDVEGMEFEVLAGARETIRKNRPILMIEVVRTRIPEFEQWCVDNRYRIVTTFHNVYAANFVAEAA